MSTLTFDDFANKYFKYTRDLTRDEQEVANSGFPYVCTINLNNPERPNALNPHGHNSDNTHRVLHGSLTINKHVDCQTWSSPETFGPRHEQCEARMGKLICYYGVAGVGRCTFIEGHQLLSPTTAKRYYGKNMIESADVNEPGAFRSTAERQVDCQAAADSREWKAVKEHLKGKAKGLGLTQKVVAFGIGVSVLATVYMQAGPGF